MGEEPTDVGAGDGRAAGRRDRRTVAGTLTELRGFARRLDLDDLREGTWFAPLFEHALATYAQRVDAARLRRAYPGLPADAVARARIRRAVRTAALEGGLSAGAYTAAVAATLGSAGAGSPVTLPAAVTSFVVDLLFTTQLQLRLAHDIAVLHGVPLDLDDPEDLDKLLRTAFVIKGGEAGRGIVGKTIPAALRPVLTRLPGAGRAPAVRSLPAVGRYLLQRRVAAFALPAVGVPLSAAVNAWSTRTTGAHAMAVFRTEGRIVDAARRMARRTAHPAELLAVLWLVVKADALVHENERLLLRHVTALLDDVDSELTAVRAFSATADLDRSAVWPLLAAAAGDLAPLYDAALTAAAVDGKVNVNELAVLRRLAGYCGAVYDEQAVRVLARGYARPA